MEAGSCGGGLSVTCAVGDRLTRVRRERGRGVSARLRWCATPPPLPIHTATQRLFGRQASGCGACGGRHRSAPSVARRRWGRERGCAAGTLRAGGLALFLASRERGRGYGTAYVEKLVDGHERSKVKGCERRLISQPAASRGKQVARWRGRVVLGTVVRNQRRKGSAGAVPKGLGRGVCDHLRRCTAAPGRPTQRRSASSAGGTRGAVHVGEAQISAGRGAEAVRPGEGLRGGHAAGVLALFLAGRERGRGCGRAYQGHERRAAQTEGACRGGWAAGGRGGVIGVRAGAAAAGRT
jgi:hypothetical protein